MGENVRVSLLEPGIFEAEFPVVRFEDDALKAASVYEGMQPLTEKNVADIVCWTTQKRPHINVDQLKVMPLAQVWSLCAVHRDS